MGKGINKSDQKSLLFPWKKWSEESASALSDTIDKKVKVREVKAEVLKSDEIPKKLNKYGSSNTLLVREIYGPMPAFLVFCAPQNQILRLVELLLHKEPNTFKGLKKENVSTVKETFNIVINHYVDGLNELFNQKFGMKEPELSINQYRAIENSMLGNIYKEKFSSILMESVFEIPSMDIETSFFMAIRHEMLDPLLNLITRKYDVSH